MTERERFERFEHGDVRSYRAGCRCLRCRAGHAEYRRRRRAGTACRFPDPSELVDATDARDHLEHLRAQGVGYRQAARLARVSEPRILNVRAGRLTQIRADTQARILMVPAILAHGQTVTGWRTWRLLDSLTGEGYTRRRLAGFLGHRTLQVGRRRCTVQTALDVKALYRHLNREASATPDAQPLHRNHASKPAADSRAEGHDDSETPLPASRCRTRRPGAIEAPTGRGHRQMGRAAHQQGQDERPGRAKGAPIHAS